MPQWQPWREKYLWTVQVADLFEVNLAKVRALWKTILELKTGVKLRFCAPSAATSSPNGPTLSIDQLMHFIDFNEIGR